MKVEFDRYDYGNGRLGLLFTPPRLQVLREVGLAGSGQDWECLLLRLLPRVAPLALVGTVFDCESDLFVSINSDPERLSELEAVFTELLGDERALHVLAKELAHGA